MIIVEQISKGVLIPSNSQPFKIISDFKESGDQPEAINTLTKNIKAVSYTHLTLPTKA